MKAPRDMSGQQLAKALAAFGCEITRQTGSHIRPTTTTGGQHHLTIPNHTSLRIGLLAAVLADVAQHFGHTREEVAKRLFG
jgi:predicted RNA binding protein YcfA (HicA-like mRNA interferase family)